MNNKFFNVGAKYDQPSGPGAGRLPPRENSQARVKQPATKINLDGVEYIRKDVVDSGEYRSSKASVPRYPANPFGEANSTRVAAVSTGRKMMPEREGAFSIDSHKNYSEGNRSETRPFRS